MATREEIYVLAMELLSLSISRDLVEIQVCMDETKEEGAPFKLIHGDGSSIELTFEQMTHWRDIYVAMGWFFRNDPVPILDSSEVNRICGSLLNGYTGSVNDVAAIIGEFYV